MTRQKKCVMAIIMMFVSCVVSVALGQEILGQPDAAQCPVDLCEALRLLNILSRPVAESEKEQKLVIDSFDPLATANAVLQDAVLPNNEQITRKPKYWPYFTSGKLHESGGLDAVIVRFTARAYTIQVVESREEAVFFVRNDEKALDMQPLSAECPVPSEFTTVFRPAMFERSKSLWNKKGKLSNGESITWVGIVKPDGPSVQALWTGRLLVLRMSKPATDVADPEPILNKPLFASPDQTLPLQAETAALKEMEEQGIAAIPNIVAFLLEQITLVPSTAAELDRQSLENASEFSARKRIITQGYRVLEDLIRRSPDADSALRQKSWERIDAVLVAHPLFVQQVRALGRTFIEVLQNSGPDGLHIMEQTLLFSNIVKQKSHLRLLLEAHPELYFQAIQGYLKAFPEAERSRICVTQTQAALRENAPAKIVATYMLGLVRPNDVPEPRLLAQILRNSRNDILHATAARQLSKWICDDADARVEIVRELGALINDPSRQVRCDVVLALRDSGDVRQVKLILPLLDDPDAQVRQAAAEAAAILLGRPKPKLPNGDLPPEWVAQIKEKAAAVLAALEDAAKEPAPVAAQ